MIYLIGGVAKAGKSYISKRIMEKYNIPFFSTDFLLWSLGSKENGGLFKYSDSDKDVSPIIEPYLEKIIYFLDKNKNDYVIEGTHVTISLFKKLNDLYPNRVKACFMGYENKDALKKYDEIIKNDQSESNKWYRQLSKDAFISFIDSKIKESKELKEECFLNKIKYFTIDDIKEKEEDIIRYLIGM